MTIKPIWPQALALTISLLSAPMTWAVEPAQAKAAPTSIAGREAAAPSAQELTQTHLQAEIADLQALLVGQLPNSTPLPALFETDLNDTTAIAQRIQSLRERVAAAPDIEADHFALLRRERDRLRLSFLLLPNERRAVLIEQDQLRRAQEALLTEQAASAQALASSERARDNALAAATTTRNDGVRLLATEEARLLAQLSELAALRQQWVDSSQRELKLRRELFARYAAVSPRTALPSTQADALYQLIRGDLKDLRKAAAQALNVLNSTSQVPELEEPLSLNDARFAEHGERVARIIQLRQRIAQEIARLHERESQERYDNASLKMTGLQSLQAQRLVLLSQLSPKQRSEATGFNAQGVARVLDEIDHIQLMARWYPLERTHDAQGLMSLLANFFTAGKFGLGVLQFLLLLGFSLWMRRHCRGWISQARQWLLSHTQQHSLRISIDRAAVTLTAIAHELTLLLSLYLIFDWLFAPAQSLAEVAVLRKLAYAYGFYALALALIHRVFLTAISRYRAVSSELNAKILRSLRWVARWVLLVSIYLIFAQALLGRGALYAIAEDIATVGALVVAWRLIRAWRSEVTQAYLSYSPTGRLAELVHKSQDHSYGIVLAATAFIFVAARGVWAWLSDLALGFEQTRKALAYLFRRQLERQLRNQVDTADLGALPEVLLKALSEEPADIALSVDHFPKLNQLISQAAALSTGGRGGLVALVGDRGAGKTSWLLALQRHIPADLPCTYYSIDQRIYDATGVCKLLSKLLGVEECTEPKHLITQLQAQPPQIVLLDLGQNLMLRTVGGLAGYDAFVSIAQATVGHVLWLVSYAAWSFDFLQRVYPNRDIYDQLVILAPWSDEEIGDLIDARMLVAGFTADYDSLLNNDALITNSPALVSEESAELIADRYHRLVWDYADGNPRLALHFFRHSLRWSGGQRVEVQLFPMPAMNALEGFATRTHYVLACLVQHENLTVAEAAASLGFAYNEVERALHLLHQREFLTISDDQRYRVSTHWNRATLRFLQRKKLLVV